MSGRKMKKIRAAMNVKASGKTRTTDDHVPFGQRIKAAWYYVCGVKPFVRKRIDGGARYRRFKKITKRGR